MKQKKAQHEIMGFVLIIIIVSVIGLIFLSFLIGRGEPITQDSIQISNLLSASMYYTSDCAINYIPNYKEGQDLIKECYSNSGRICLNEESVCDSLNSTMKKLIGESLDVSPDKPNKAYKLNIYYTELDAENNEYIMNFTKGNFEDCSSEAGASQEIFYNPGQIVVELDFCYGE